MKKKNQPIAITGIACRFPAGCNGPDTFWEMLCNQTDFITEVKPDRWARDYYFHPDPSAVGKTYTLAAGQIDDVYHFDPSFFGISPREATQMDPQQRLLLQLSWEALENGAQIPAALAGTDCSVYIGISSLDYANTRMDDPGTGDAYFMTGNTLSIAANRLSYIYDIHGPSMAIDTACSSSLVALHQACSGIWSGESSSSLVGAVHLLLSPYPFIGFSKASMLSSQGHSAVFDASADGYVRSEGGVVLFLKPLAEAEADGDPIHAVILGTATNSDGRNESLTIPNGMAQSRLLESVYRKSGIKANEISYIEAHGTGTRVGDPVEATAIGRAIGSRRKKPVLIGSVKSNIGHLEPASGFAGLMKVVLSLKHRALPACIHQSVPNPDIDFENLNVQVVRSYTEFAENETPLIMGVNSFGFGGANAHVILQEYPRDRELQQDADIDRHPPLLLSAASEFSLKQRAIQFTNLLAKDLTARQTYDLFHTCAYRRQRLKHSLLAFGDSTREIRQALQAFVEGEKTVNVVTASVIPTAARVVFVYSGNGSQWAGMARSLLDNAMFRQTLEDIDACFKPLSGWSLIEGLQNDKASSGLDYTEVAQPLLFAVQAGITTLLRQEGVDPEIVIGHSIGEVAAAWVAGALTLEDAVRVVYFRSIAQAKTRGMGRMVAIRLSPERVEDYLRDIGDGVSISAVNSPESVTVSGMSAEIRKLVDILKEDGIVCRELDLDYPFHHRIMDGVREDFLESIGTIAAGPAGIEFISSVSGRIEDGPGLDAGYWWDNIRRPVRFGEAVSLAAASSTVPVFVEIGPHPVLQSYLRECSSTEGPLPIVLKTLRRDDPDEYRSIRSTASRVLLSSPAPLPDRLFPVAARYVDLPAYPWENSPYKFTASTEAVNRYREHALLGIRHNSIEGVWQNQIDLVTHPYLADHVIDGMAVFPAAGFIEMALAASRSWLGRDVAEITGLEIRRPLLLEPGKTRDIQFTLSPVDLYFSIKSRERLSDQKWVEHVSGRLTHALRSRIATSIDPAAIIAESTNILSGSGIYAITEKLGMHYGDSFRRALRSWVSPDGSFTELATKKTGEGTDVSWRVDPATLDSAFHGMIAALYKQLQNHNFCRPLLPVEIGRVYFYGNSTPVKYCQCAARTLSANLIKATIGLYDESGTPVIELAGCIFRRMAKPLQENGTPTRYQYRQIPRNLLTSDQVSPTIPMEKLIENLGDLHKEEIIEMESTSNEEILPLMDALASALAESVFRKLGASPGEFTLESLISTYAIPSRYRPLLSYLLNILEQDGKVLHSNTGWMMVDDAVSEDPVAIWRSILGDYPHCIDVCRQIAAMAFRIVEVITGQQEPGCITPCQGMSGFTQLTSLQHNVCRNMFEAIHREWPATRKRLRILEINTGATRFTRDLVTMLDPKFCDYEILVLDETAAGVAVDNYRDLLHVTVSGPDTENDSIVHRYREGEFDIVLVSDCLHRYADMHKLLTDLSYVLASGGLLVMLEQDPIRLEDINMGLVDDTWWIRSTAMDYPVSKRLYAQDWLGLLALSGFDEGANLTDEVVRGSNRFVLAARRVVREKPETTRTDVAGGSCLIISKSYGESHSIASVLSRELQNTGMETAIVYSETDAGTGGNQVIDLDDYTSATRVIDKFRSSLPSPHHFIYLSGTDHGYDEKSVHGISYQLVAHTMKTVNLVKAISNGAGEYEQRLWLLTRGALSVENALDCCIPDSVQAGQWGLGRVIRNEYPHLDTRMIDIQIDDNPDMVARRLSREIINTDGEEEIIHTDHARKVLRIIRADTRENEQEFTGRDDGSMVRQLGFDRPGSLDNLKWTPVPRKAPGDDQVEIEVVASGLNFRDIMYASGLLPDEILEGGFSGTTLGLECSGIVTRTGYGVTDLTAGDAVIAFAPASFSSHITTSRVAVIKKPDFWSFEEAAAVPVAFLTVCYALGHLAGLRQGERVLIHGAAGSVGLAAIQYARHCGAEIFATAGSDEKRRFLKLLGVDHVMDSRTLDFADDILAITAGAGVDVILNSLAGEAIVRNLGILRPFGRFLELGKRDFYENTRMALRPFRNNIAYYGVDVDQLLMYQPELSQQLITEMMQLFEQGIFRPLPYTVFPQADTVSAFRYMQESRHIGKIIIRNSDTWLPARSANLHKPLWLTAHGTYLVSGGVGGFGLATAKWLAEKGARHLVLLGRNGVKTTEDALLIEELRRHPGMNLQIVRGDVTSAIDLKKVLNDIESTGFPLKGVIHSAMVIEDSTIAEITPAGLNAVLLPKVQGAWNLHTLTLDCELDMFVMYSSATTCIGNPGQAAYVTANMFLESLSNHRRNAGLPSVCVAWDAITDTGYLSRNEQIGARLAHSLGINGMRSSTALNELETILGNGDADTIVLNANWMRMRRTLPVSRAHLFDDIMHGIRENGTAYEVESIAEMLAGLSESEKQIVVSRVLAAEISRILRVAEEKIEHNATLQDIGIDSLMAMELVSAIEEKFGINMPVMILADNITLDSLSTRLVRLLDPDHGGVTQAHAMNDIVSSFARAHAEDLSAEDVAAISRVVESNQTRRNIR